MDYVLYQQTIEKAERAVELATERLDALREYGRGPVGAAGCCRSWTWTKDPLGAGYRWERVLACNVKSDDSDACEHEHHETDGTWQRIAIG